MFSALPRFCFAFAVLALPAFSRPAVQEETEKPKITLKTAIAAPAAVASLARQSATSCLLAVAGASRLGGGGERVVTTGTLTQTDEGERKWEYASEPDDRLRVVFAGGAKVEYFVEAAEGDPSGDAFNFLTNAHRLIFRVSAPGTGELRISSVRTRELNVTSLVGSMKGRARLGDTEFTLDVKFRGRTFTESTQGSAETEDELRMSGTLKAPGFSMEVDERTGGTFIAAGGAMASTSSRVFDDRWTLDGAKYRFKGAISRHFEKSRPTDLDNWRAEGALFKDGEKLGALRKDLKVPKHWAKILLDLPEEKIEIESYSY